MRAPQVFTVQSEDSPGHSGGLGGDALLRSYSPGRANLWLRNVACVTWRSVALSGGPRLPVAGGAIQRVPAVGLCARCATEVPKADSIRCIAALNESYKF